MSVRKSTKQRFCNIKKVLYDLTMATDADKAKLCDEGYSLRESMTTPVRNPLLVLLETKTMPVVLILSRQILFM
jgi:hypothetical protein